MSIQLLKREPLSTKIPENEGRLFYVFFSFLSTKAYDLIPSSVKERYPKWSIIYHENPMNLRNMVASKVFDNFKDLCVELDDLPKADKIRLKIISTDFLQGGAFDKFLSSHVDIMYLWDEIRVEGVLWYLGCCNEGGVLAYLGDSDEEECIFIVKVLSSSYSELLDNAPKLNPDLNYSCFETVLLPWKDYIINHGIFTPYLSYTPKEFTERHERLNDTISRCERKGKVRKSLSSADSIKTERLHVMGQHFSHFMKDPHAPMGLGRTKSTSTEFHVNSLESF